VISICDCVKCNAIISVMGMEVADGVDFIQVSVKAGLFFIMNVIM
jgi:hypothetical protein